MNQIETLVAEREIKNQLYLYCKGVDARDWSLVRSCFGDEHVHNHGSFSGPVSEFIEFAKSSIEPMKATQHSISNVIIRFSEDGLSAMSDAQFCAVHFIEGAAVARSKIVSGDQDSDWMVAGTYHDNWVYRDGAWLIVERNAKHHWERFEPASPR